MRLIIIIPAYNEALNIVSTVNAVKEKCPFADYIVVNDGSADNTGQLCRSNGFPLLDLPLNLGLAGAFQAGMRYACLHEYDYAIQLDGDGQHDPSFVASMLDEMQHKNVDIVIGSRFVTEKKPKTMRMFGSNLISFAIRMTTGKYVADPTSGMRLYNKRMIELFANNINYGPEPDTIAHLIRKKILVKEVQVAMHDRTAGESYLKPVRAAKYMVNMFVSIVIVQYFR